VEDFDVFFQLLEFGHLSCIVEVGNQGCVIIGKVRLDADLAVPLRIGKDLRDIFGGFVKPLVMFGDEDKKAIPDDDLVTMAENMFFDPLPVDESAILAVQVHQGHCGSVSRYSRVLLGNMQILNLDQVFGDSAESGLRLIQGNRSPVKASCCTDQFRRHRVVPSMKIW